MVQKMFLLFVKKIITHIEILHLFRTFTFDTLKIEHVAHKAKTSDPAINKDNDDQLLLVNDGRSLAKWGISAETELSFFKKEDYLLYKENPTLVW